MGFRTVKQKGGGRGKTVQVSSRRLKMPLDEAGISSRSVNGRYVNYTTYEQDYILVSERKNPKVLERERQAEEKRQAQERARQKKEARQRQEYLARVEKAKRRRARDRARQAERDHRQAQLNARDEEKSGCGKDAAVLLILFCTGGVAGLAGLIGLL